MRSPKVEESDKVMAALSSGARMSSSSSRDEVYVAAVALKGPAQLLFSTAYSLNFWDLQHFMVILKHRHQHEATVYDFQPEDPENIWVAAAALSRTKIPGAILVRKLAKLPKRKCWFVGYAKADIDDDALHKFNHTWDTHLVLGSHDCRHYTQARPCGAPHRQQSYTRPSQAKGLLLDTLAYMYM
ncbi:uncharacterized protein LOC131009569 isoform X4 [Salvia miltiorrhiza]|uniref:uncharacterized protein LOC131009569 isoform X4 n=1 Tax=Salvia miltiorrhiza TaxID=226208 RepID=UPI0025AC63E0|nr:uncharacterized protein LOC131009569 isoform X4 [Salvia miltiorrhiza]